MRKDDKQGADPSMPKIRQLFKESGLSLHELGLKMGYPHETARQAAWQSLRAGDPRISTLRRFAEALEVPLEGLVAGSKRRPG